jgi:hypothetical protein
MHVDAAQLPSPVLPVALRGNDGRGDRRAAVIERLLAVTATHWQLPRVRN